MATEVKKMNDANPTHCYTPVCGSNGRCTYQDLPLPSNMKYTKCMEPVCKKMPSGSYAWSYVATEVNKTCKSDACSYRQCRNDADATKFPDGCYWEDICTNRTTECEIYTCDTSGASAQCKMTPAKFEETECTKEVCKEGKKVWVDKDIDKVCHPPDKCYESLCYNGKCEYVKRDPDGDDPCKIYTCDPLTGNFSEKPKCDDGLFCTTNLCDVFGECKYEPIECEGEISMEGYPCFEPRCKEDPDNENNEKHYKCVRKLMHNAYVDVCGNCIVDEVSSDDVSSSASASAASASAASASAASASGVPASGSSASGGSIPTVITSSMISSGVDLLECTGAPPRPLLTEGLAAASIGLIIIGAVVIGAAIATSGVLGTKALIDRARQADNQSAHSNPLYQNNDAEMTNPAFAEAM